MNKDYIKVEMTASTLSLFLPPPLSLYKLRNYRTGTSIKEKEYNNSSEHFSKILSATSSWYGMDRDGVMVI